MEILIGIVSGIIGGLGMGGGTVLILLLSLFLDIEQHIAQATNIVFFVPTAISAITDTRSSTPKAITQRCPWIFTTICAA